MLSTKETGEREIERPRRPDVGTTGKKIQLAVNMFPVNFDSALTIHHYGDNNFQLSFAGIIKLKINP